MPPLNPSSENPASKAPLPMKPLKQWKSLDELSGAPELKEFVNFEFPEGADVLGADVSRRRFLQVMGAGMAFAGLTGCKGIRRPEMHILPYNKMPESLVPGVAQFYATTLSLSGDAIGLLVEAHEGRPTKIEGNPSHPASLGSTSRQHQATILDLYNPERSQTPYYQSQPSTWDTYGKEVNLLFASMRQGGVNGGNGGEGLCFLSGYTASPSFRALRDYTAQVFPKAKWFVYEPINRDNALQGLYALTGQALEPLYHFDRAKRVLAIDCDFLDSEPFSVAYARAFAQSRNPDLGQAGMSRLYVVESHYSLTGGSSDHRLRVKPSAIPFLVASLAKELQAQGLNLSGVDVASLPSLSTSDTSTAWIKALATDLIQHRGQSIIAVGKYQPPAVHALAHALNMALGNVAANSVQATVELRPSVVHALNAADPKGAPENSVASLRALGQELDAGKVDALVILDANPAYSAPADLGFAAQIAKAKLSIHLGPELDDTGVLCTWHLPMSHYLETWGDAIAYDGTSSIAQPLISPLYSTVDATELLAALSGYPKTQSHAIVQDTWSKHLGKGQGEGQGAADALSFEKTWRRWLNDGIVSAGSASGTNAPGISLNASSLNALLKTFSATSTSSTGDIEIILREHPNLGDGRFANNAWMQEVPEPMTKLTWDNAALMSPKLAEKVGIRQDLLDSDNTGSPMAGYLHRPMVRLTVNGQSLDVVAWVMPGMAEDTVLLHLGFGRMHVGAVGEEAGVNAYTFMTAANPFAPGTASVGKLDRTYPVASTQDHWSMGKRPLVRDGKLDDYLDNPTDYASEEKWNEHPPEQSLWSDDSRGDYDFTKGMQWGMAIDLNSCTGCNACMIACQSENNIPSVGKEQVMLGRDMHWIRLDRYFAGDIDDPELEFQPMTCQQCENAPCEEVCPVGATVHSHEGLNDMVYNRCVGTRYCSNNCPYKVRRFNFFNYNNGLAETEKMRFNPDVTLRFRGVMEKCTYCVQRINRARIDSENQGHELIADGAITPACGQACPSQAIVFGNINDPESRVAKLKQHPRNYGVLRDLNTKPRTSYLARVRNPNPALAV